MAETVRIDPAAHAALVAIAKEKDLTLTDALTCAVEAYRRATFLAGVARDFKTLRADPVAWAEDQAEIELWDTTSNDGLEDEPPYGQP